MGWACVFNAHSMSTLSSLLAHMTQPWIWFSSQYPKRYKQVVGSSTISAILPILKLARCWLVSWFKFLTNTETWSPNQIQPHCLFKFSPTFSLCKVWLLALTKSLHSQLSSFPSQLRIQFPLKDKFRSPSLPTRLQFLPLVPKLKFQSIMEAIGKQLLPHK